MAAFEQCTRRDKDSAKPAASAKKPENDIVQLANSAELASQSVISMMKQPVRWAANSNEATKRDQALTEFLISTGLPVRLVDDDKFRKFCGTLDPKYILPGSTKQNGLLDKQYKDAVSKVKEFVSVGKRLTIGMDCWSKKGLTASFLGISACFFNPNYGIPQHVLLNLYKIAHPNTGEMLAAKLKESMEQWGISPRNILMVVTDNGSNMVKAIRLAAFSEVDDHRGSDDGDIDNTDEVMETVDNDDSDGEEDNAFDDAIPLHLHRFPCLAHTLQLVLKDVEKNACYGATLSKARSIVKKVRISSVATEKLMEKCGKTVVTDCSTRWNSNMFMLERMLDVKEGLKETLDEMKWDSLLASEWRKLEDLYNILKPFTDHTNLLQTDSFALSNVIPVLLDLSCHLQEQQSSLAHSLLKSLSTRFDSILKSSHPLFDKLPAVACLLDPTVGHIMLTTDMAGHLAAAKAFIIEEVVKDAAAHPGDSHKSDTTDVAENVQPPPMKRFKFLSKKLNEKVAMATCDSVPAVDMELSRYMSELENLNAENISAIEFWLSRVRQYEHISRFALDLVSAPASQAYVERVFSLCGDLSARKRNRAGVNLERRVFLKLNSRVLQTAPQ